MLGGVAEWNYQLIVEGELGDHLKAGFHGTRLTRTGGNTVLTGTVRDQAELQGVLERVSDFGLTLLEVRALDDRADPQARMQIGSDRVLPALAGREPTMATGSLDGKLTQASWGLPPPRAMDGVRWWMTRP